MNRQITRLFMLVAVLFGLLVAFTSRWAVFDSDSLRDNPLNVRSLLQELRIDRGKIVAAGGEVLARSVPARGDTYRRVYPQAGLFAQTVGYSNTARGQRTGLERSRNSWLLGRQNEFTSIADELRGRRRRGDNVITTLDPTAQRVALAQLGDRRGAVVALDPRSGAVKVMASVPGFDPNHLPKQGDQERLGSPLFNRATQAGYPPGSTFKVVTAAAGLDTGEYTPDSVLNGNSPQTFSGVPLQNDGGASFGPIDLTTALTHSVNTVWAQVAEHLGKKTMGEYMKRFGFYAKPPLDYPADQRAASGEYGSDGKLLDPLSDQIDVARMGIGQDKLQVTPLQMAMVAAAVANGGKLMSPHLTDRVVDPDGRTVKKISPSLHSTVMKPSSARELTTMMQNVVEEGTGTAAALAGIDVAGKTGTAQIDPATGVTQPWFIAFAPAGDPRIAIAVTVERSEGGEGGVVAAPIARAVMESLLREQ